MSFRTSSDRRAEHGPWHRYATVAALLLGCGAAAAVRPMLRPPVPGQPAGAALDLPAEQSATASRLAGAPLVHRSFYRRRLEPAGDAILHGAGQTDRRSFESYTAAVGPDAPMLFMTYADLRDDLPGFFERLRGDLEHFDGRTAGAPVVPQIGLSMNGGQARRHYEADVAEGADDAAIAELCVGLRMLDRPVFLRVGYEFNGVWNGYRAETYTAAFKRVADAVHACGKGRVAVVWNWSVDAELDAETAGMSPDTLGARLREFYPGDDAVDWWAVNLFSAEGIVAPATQTFLAEAERSRHPVMVAESTPKGLGATQAGVRSAWFEPYFGLVRSSPGIRAFCYIDWDWAGYPQWVDWGDARIETDAGLLGWYRAEVHALPLLRPGTAGELAQLLRTDESVRPARFPVRESP